MKPRGMPLIIALAAVLVLAASLAQAQTSKLSPRARIALAELRAGADPKVAQQEGLPIDASTGALDVFIQGDVSRAELEAAGAIVRTEIFGTGVFTAFVPESAIEAVEALPGVQRIRGAVTCVENLNTSIPTTLVDIQRGAGPTFAGANGQGVMIGDIDSGISYAHGDFDDASANTRILRIWDQTNTTGTPPSGYTYGSEYLPAAINANSAQGKDTNGHGTHVMGIAAGDGSLTGGSIPAYTYVGMAPMADIVEIKSTYTDTQILDGANYFFGLATSLGKNAVLNISLGGQYGPHDGQEPLSVGLNSLVTAGHAICVSAGNDAGTTSPLEHIHARPMATYPTAASAVLTLSGTGSGRIVGVDGYYDNLDAIRVTISHPTYGSFGPYALGTINAAYPGVPFGTGGTKGYLYVENGAAYSASGDPEVYVEIKAGTTSGSTFNGNWTFTFTPIAASGPMNGQVDLWKFYASTTAIVANFSSGISDLCLLGGDIATSANVITCGAWITKTNWTNCYGYNISYNPTTPPTTVGLIASFSSPGPTRDGRMKPDIAAPGQAIGSTMTQDVTLGTCNTTSTYYSYLNDNMKHWINQGTSMAAPHVTGAVALLFQKFGALTRPQIMAKLSALALVDGNTGSVPNNTWGAGKLRVDVTNPTVLVGYPNGSEVLDIGTPINITWSATDVWSGVANVDIQLSRDNGGTWENIVLATANSGSYGWSPTGPSTTQALVRVKAHDVVDNIGQDQSNAVFTIANPPVPVEMTLFQAEATDAGVRISWSFVDPEQYVAAFVERASSAQGSWSRLDTPVTTASGVSSVVDGTAQSGRTYFYRVEGTDRRGVTTPFGPISIAAGVPITAFRLNPIWPNPARGMARVDFSVPRDSHVTLRVFDIQGRAVATLADQNYAPGQYQTSWDLRTSDGSAAASGIYFVHMLSPGNQFVQRVVLSR